MNKKWKVEYYFRPNGWITWTIYEAKTSDEARIMFENEVGSSWVFIEATEYAQ